MNPFVSIIVPVYNVEQHLTRCLDSLLNQEYSNYEILLINDGSTDNSGKICDAYQEKNNIIKVYHLENGGVSNARNFGIENCKGDFVQFVDSDDYVNETYIYCMVDKIKDKKVDLVISGIKQVRLEENKIYLIKEIISTHDGLYKKNELKQIISDLIESSYINYCYSKLISRELLLENNIRFEKNISLGEDTLFVLDVIRYSENINILALADYNYLIHSNNTLTYKFRPEKFNILNNLSRKILNFCIEENYYTDDVRETLDKRYMETIRFCLDENFKPHNNNNILNKLKTISEILKNEDVTNFVAKDKIIFKNYPSSLIKAIKSKNSLRYFFTYYNLIFLRKLRELL